VFYLDYGDQEWLYLRDIYPINDMFLQMPFLYRLCPLGKLDNTKWDEKDMNVFSKHLEDNFGVLTAVHLNQYSKNSLNYSNVRLFGYDTKSQQKLEINLNYVDAIIHQTPI
jgi:hypothetical protein